MTSFQFNSPFKFTYVHLSQNLRVLNLRRTVKPDILFFILFTYVDFDSKFYVIYFSLNYPTY